MRAVLAMTDGLRLRMVASFISLLDLCEANGSENREGFG